MELRKDPITRSWVVTGDDAPVLPSADGPCRFCIGARDAHVVSSMPGLHGAWSARAVVHPATLYHVEGEPGRRGDGIYDRMRPIGAHEVLVENPRHDRHLWNAGDDEIVALLSLAAHRILDLKGDNRFKYVSIFKNSGALAGQEFEHPVSQLTATTFVPRRILYELRAGREYFQQKERCVYCDILAQEQRQAVRLVDTRGDYVAWCPFAPRVPYETWIMPRAHDAMFERYAAAKPASLRDCAALLRRTLTRIRTITTNFHVVLHTAPNSNVGDEMLGYWKTIEDDFHWHIEILPIVPEKLRSYTVKEVYYTPVLPETAAARLREIKVDV